MWAFTDILKIVQGDTMSKTSRRERTKGSLDRLEKIRKDRKLIRCLKADEMFCDLQNELHYITQFEY